MKVFRIILVAVLICSAAVAEIIEIRTLNGSSLKGTVTSKTASEINFRTEFGVQRIPASVLTPESLKLLGFSADGVDVRAVMTEMEELKKKVLALEEENQRLRMQLSQTQGTGIQGLSSGRVPSTSPTGSSSRVSPSPTSGASSPSGAGLSYTVSSTGKRHNSRCRYYGTGRSAGPTDGVACKICGG